MHNETADIIGVHVTEPIIASGASNKMSFLTVMNMLRKSLSPVKLSQVEAVMISATTFLISCFSSLLNF